MAKNVRARKSRAEEQRDLDVEISFLAGLVRRDTHWIDALKLLGDSYTKRGCIHEGLRVDEQLASLCPEDSYVFYNLACSYSRAERLSESFAALDRAFKLGYADVKWLAKDPDMANLRRHPAYKEFVGKFKTAK